MPNLIKKVLLSSLLAGMMFFYIKALSKPVLIYSDNKPTFLYTSFSRHMTESEKKKRPVRRYIRPCIYSNFYTTAKQSIPSAQLKSYKFSQANTGFYFPLYTSSWYRKDSISLANFHVLTTGNLLSASPRFSGLEKQHRLYKFSIGVRAIYNTGKKNIWFFTVSPFVSQDNYTISSPTSRLASVILFNRTVSKKFSYRIGVIKTFIFGNRYHLPIIGLRIGPLDGTYLSIQIPKNISLNFPINPKLTGSIFIKPLGGIYLFSNVNTNFYQGDSVFVFGRYEFLTGISTSYRINNDFSCFMSAGIANKRKINFAGDNFEGTFKSFYRTDVAPTLFINMGLTIRLGKVIKVYNDINMYDVLDINNAFDPGDDNDGPLNTDIPVLPKDNAAIKKIQYKDVEDLISEYDLY